MTILVKGLRLRLGHHVVLRDVNAVAEAGRLIAVLGPNAAGKSSLLRCLAGLIAPSEGRIDLDGRAVSSWTSRERAERVAYVGQRPTASAAFTVRQMIELGRYALRPSREAVSAAMHELELTQLAEEPFHHLSVGQQQRVSLARALAQMPRAGHLVLDEPTSAMDLKYVDLVMKLLNRRARDQGVVVFATHDVGLAAAMCDEAWLLCDGRLVEAGRPEQVLQPSVLEAVFKVCFERVALPGGRSRLLPLIG